MTSWSTVSIRNHRKSGDMNREAARQQIFRGIPASGGIAIATAFLLERETDLYIPLRKISEQQVKREVAKYRAALDATRRELDIAKEQQGKMESIRMGPFDGRGDLG